MRRQLSQGPQPRPWRAVLRSGRFPPKHQYLEPTPPSAPHRSAAGTPIRLIMGGPKCLRSSWVVRHDFIDLLIPLFGLPTARSSPSISLKNLLLLSRHSVSLAVLLYRQHRWCLNYGTIGHGGVDSDVFLSRKRVAKKTRNGAKSAASCSGRGGFSFLTKERPDHYRTAPSRRWFRVRPFWFGPGRSREFGGHLTVGLMPNVFSTARSFVSR